MRHPARTRRRAHIDQALDTVQLQQLDELVQRACRMTDRQNYERSVGSTSGTRTLFVYVCPLYENVPEKR